MRTADTMARRYQLRNRLTQRVARYGLHETGYIGYGHHPITGAYTIGLSLAAYDTEIGHRIHSKESFPPGAFFMKGQPVVE